MRTWLARHRGELALLLAASLLSLMLGELLIRTLELAPPVKAIRISDDTTVYKRSDNPLLGFELKAGYRNPEANLIVSYPSTNTHGQRDVERSVSKPAGTRRVILLGDSVVEGERVREIDDLMSRQLERMYPQGHTEVLNFGVSGYNTRAEVELLEVKGLRFEPDVVVLVFVANDFENFTRPLFEMGTVVERPELVKSLFLHSHLFRLASLRLNWFQFGAESDPVAVNRLAMGDNNVLDGLERLAELAGRHGFEPLIAIWPSFGEREIFDPHPMPDDSEELIIERLARVYGIPSFRMSRYFRAALPEGKDSPRLRFTTAGDRMHPNPEGNVVAAAALYAELGERGNHRPGVTGATPAERRSAAAEAIAAARARGRTLSDAPDIRARLNTADALFTAGRLQESIDAHRAIVDDHPEHGAARANLGAVLLVDGDVDGAIEQLERALRIVPDNANAHYNLGNARRIAGQSEAAVAAYRRAVQLAPGMAKAHRELGWNLYEQGATQEALASFERAVQLDPGDAHAHSGLSAARQALGQSAPALDAARQALALAPADAGAHLRLGTLLLSTGELHEAATYFRRAAELQPTLAEAHSRLGATLLQLEERSAGLASLRRALELAPEQPAAHFYLGATLAASGDYAGAVRHYRAVARHEAAPMPVLNNLAWLLATCPQPAVRDPAEAIIIASRAVERSAWRDPVPLDTLAAAYAADGQFQRARETAASALALAEAAAQTSLVEEIRARSRLYEAGQAYRQPPPAAHSN